MVPAKVSKIPSQRQALRVAHVCGFLCQEFHAESSLGKGSARSYLENKPKAKGLSSDRAKLEALNSITSTGEKIFFKFLHSFFCFWCRWGRGRECQASALHPQPAAHILTRHLFRSPPRDGRKAFPWLELHYG
jgi:hypothetical protein